MSDQHQLVAALADSLDGLGWQAATVESCTGGGIAALLTSVAGSSGWFERGFVTYSNASKSELVGVPAELIAQHGAVSALVAEAMARGGVTRSRAHCAMAVTGIAGPDGGTADKPVGTVCFGWAVPGRADGDALEVDSETRLLDGDRAAIRQQSVAMALLGLLTRLDKCCA